MRPATIRSVVLPLILSAWSAVATAGGRQPLEGFDAYVTRVMQEFEVPGLAVAVVKDGGVVLAKGYGVRRWGETTPVDADTLFGIASNTKAFTCAALAILAEEGRLSWDDPVTLHLPSFQMYDPWVTREVTVRDLVTHRAGLGLGEGDLMWWPPTDHTREEIIRGIRYLKPASSFRSSYAYSNVMFAAAGELLAEVAGKRWEDVVREKILAPLGMSRTNTSMGELRSAENVAAPHIRVKGALTPMDPMAMDNAAAAGAVNSSASDMGLWLRMLLECSGSQPPAGGNCLLKSTSIRQMWTPQAIVPIGEPAPGLEALQPHFAAYGLGFSLRDYLGRKIVAHTGGLPGYVSQVALVPEERLGLVVLTNQEATGAFRSVMYRIFDGYLGAPTPPVDWIAAFRKSAEDERHEVEKKVAEQAARRDASSRPSLPLAAYAGRYRDPWYGVAEITEEGRGLVLNMTRTPRMVADLEHWHYDTFVARWRVAFMSEDQSADAYLTFTLRPDGSIEHFKMMPVSPAIDFSFDYQDLLFTPVSEESGQGGVN